MNLLEYNEAGPVMRVDPYGFEGFIPFPPLPGGGCMNPLTGLPCGETPPPTSTETIIVTIGVIAIAIDIATIPSGEGPIIAGGIRQCFKELCESAAKKKARREAAERAVRGLRRELEEHKQRLWEYMRDPLSKDNKGILRDAIARGAPPQQIRSIVEGRIRNLQGQIDNFQRQIDEILRCM